MNYVVPPTAMIRDAIGAIEQGRIGIAVVLGQDGVLEGTLTDGDIRRAILAGHELEEPVTFAMRRSAFTVSPEVPRLELLKMLEERGLEAAPVIAHDGKFSHVVHIRDLQGLPVGAGGAEQFYGVVVMAGGEGRRLRPVTQDMPKPMVDVGGMPVLERLVRSFVQAGIPRIFLATNYLGHVIENHFGDGQRFGVPIRYLREEEKKGTAGAVTLLPDIPTAPLLVVNGDVLTTSDFKHLYAYHEERRSDLTIAAKDYRMQVPYGVIRNDGDRVLAVEEKPSQRFLCNAGIYVLSPSVLPLIPRQGSFDMTDLISAAVAAQNAVHVFPIHEYWTDIGNVDDLAQAKLDIGE